MIVYLKKCIGQRVKEHFLPHEISMLLTQKMAAKSCEDKEGGREVRRKRRGESGERGRGKGRGCNYTYVARN